MTASDSPYYPAQPERQAQKAHPVQPPPQDDETVRNVALILAAGGTFVATVAGLKALLAPLGVSDEAIQAALGLANHGTSHRPNGRLDGTGLRTSTGPIKTARDSELYYRASYLLNASQRIERSLSRGEPIRVALADESTFYRAHERARENRLKSAAKVYNAARLWGNLLGWYLNPLLNNDPECIAADGHNFYADEGTVIGLPGSVHPHCGCTAGPPIEGAPLVNQVLANVIRLAPAKRHHLRVKKGA